MGVDLFTQTLRDVIYALGFGASAGAMVWCLCVIAGTIRHPRRANPGPTSQSCHCILVDAPHDWDEHPDWIS